MNTFKRIAISASMATLFLTVSAQNAAVKSGTSAQKQPITSVCTSSFLNEHLVQPLQFKPVPVYGDAYWRDSIPEAMKQSFIAQGEKYLNAKWETTNIVLFSEYRGNGDRDRNQKHIFGKRNQLMSLAMAEIMEGKGRFMNDIMNGLFSICEETWWGVPAHYGPNIPLVENQSMDLFNAETAGMMAWMYYMFNQPMQKFSPHLSKRIKNEISRRILQEGKNKKEWWRNASMNWNPWICSNWLACVLFTEDNRSKQLEYTQLILNSLDGFIAGYPEDGGCDEGSSYWDRAAGSLFDCLNLMKMATNGAFNLANNPKVQQMGNYIAKMNVGNGYYVNFADAGPKMTPHVEWFPSALYLNNHEMTSLIANAAHQLDFWNKAGNLYTSTYLCSFNRELLLLTHLSQLKEQSGKDVLLYDSWLPRIQVMTARSYKNSFKGLYLAAKGGHNNESHNHNDVGNFIVYADGQPLLVDVGPSTYRKETFNNATRYDIWSMQSGYHNVPKINGVDQRFGSEYKAQGTSVQIKSKNARLDLDIAKAYPAEAKVKTWNRTINLQRGKQIDVTENYELNQFIAPTQLMFMTQVEPVVKGNIVSMNINGTPYGIVFNPQQIKATVEKMNLTDENIAQRWGTLYRIHLTVVSNDVKGSVKYAIRKL